MDRSRAVSRSNMCKYHGWWDVPEQRQAESRNRQIQLRTIGAKKCAPHREGVGSYGLTRAIAAPWHPCAEVERGKRVEKGRDNGWLDEQTSGRRGRVARMWM